MKNYLSTYLTQVKKENPVERKMRWRAGLQPRSSHHRPPSKNRSTFRISSAAISLMVALCGLGTVRAVPSKFQNMMYYCEETILNKVGNYYGPSFNVITGSQTPFDTTCSETDFLGYQSSWSSLKIQSVQSTIFDQFLYDWLEGITIAWQFTDESSALQTVECGPLSYKSSSAEIIPSQDANIQEKVITGIAFDYDSTNYDYFTNIVFKLDDQTTFEFQNIGLGTNNRGGLLRGTWTAQSNHFLVGIKSNNFASYHSQYTTGLTFVTVGSDPCRCEPSIIVTSKYRQHQTFDISQTHQEVTGMFTINVCDASQWELIGTINAYSPDPAESILVIDGAQCTQSDFIRGFCLLRDTAQNTIKFIVGPNSDQTLNHAHTGSIILYHTERYFKEKVLFSITFECNSGVKVQDPLPNTQLSMQVDGQLTINVYDYLNVQVCTEIEDYYSFTITKDGGTSYETSITSTDTFYQASFTTPTLVISPNNDAKFVGNYQIVMEVSLDSFTQTNSATITLSIVECQVDTFEFLKTELNESYEYTLTSEPMVINIPTAYSTPDCKFDSTLQISVDDDIDLPNWITFDSEVQTLTIETTDAQYVGGPYQLQISQTLQNSHNNLAIIESTINIQTENVEDTYVIDNLQPFFREDQLYERMLNNPIFELGTLQTFRVIIFDYDLDPIKINVITDEEEDFVTVEQFESLTGYQLELTIDIPNDDENTEMETKPIAGKQFNIIIEFEEIHSGYTVTRSYDFEIQAQDNEDNSEEVQETPNQVFDSGLADNLEEYDTADKLDEEEYEQVEATVDQVTGLGFVTIPFSIPVQVPESWYLYTEEDFMVLYIQNSYEDEVILFSYNLTEYTKDYLTISLQFSAPLDVSQIKNNPDIIMVYLRRDFFLNPAKCVGHDCSRRRRNRRRLRQTIDYEDDSTFQKIQTELPKQYPNEEEAEVIQNLQETLGTTAQNIFWGSMVLQIFLNKAMKSVWIIFSCLQLIVAMTMFNLSFPVNLQKIYQGFNDIINLTLVPKQQIYETVMATFMDNIPTSEDEQTNMLYQIMLTIAGIIIFCLLACCITLFVSGACTKLCCNCCNKIFQSIKRKFMYNSIFRFILQTYLANCISCFLALSAISFSSSLNKVNGVVSIMILLLLLAFPCYSYRLLRKNFKELNKKEFKESYGSLYQNLDTYKSKAMAERLLFLFRRLLFGLTVIIDYTAAFQFALTAYLSLMYQSYNIIVKPMQDSLMNSVQILLEFVVYTCCILLCMFTEYITTQDTRYQLGWGYLYLLIIFITITLILLIIGIVIDIYQYLKKRFTKPKQNQVIELKRMPRIQHRVTNHQSAKQSIIDQIARTDFSKTPNAQNSSCQEEDEPQQEPLARSKVKTKHDLLSDLEDLANDSHPKERIESDNSQNYVKDISKKPTDKLSLYGDLELDANQEKKQQEDEKLNFQDQNESIAQEGQQQQNSLLLRLPRVRDPLEDTQEKLINHNLRDTIQPKNDDKTKPDLHSDPDYQQKLEQEQKDILYMINVNKEQRQQVMESQSSSLEAPVAYKLKKQKRIGTSGTFLLDSSPNSLQKQQSSSDQMEKIKKLEDESKMLNDMLRENIDKQYTLPSNNYHQNLI